MGGKLFSSYRPVFELAQSFRDSKTNDLNCSYEALVQKNALTICHDGVFASFLCVLSLSSVLGRFIQLYHPGNGMYPKGKGICPEVWASFWETHQYFMVYIFPGVLPKTVGYLSSGIIPAEAIDSEQAQLSTVRYSITSLV